MTECLKDDNLEHCTCTYTSCGKRGMCCQCLRSHFQHGELPGCVFPEDLERTYDRSIQRFVAAFQERGPWW